MSSRKHRNRIPLCHASQDNDGEEVVNQPSEASENPAPRKIVVPPHLRPPSEVRFYRRADITTPSAPYSSRRASVGGFPFRPSRAGSRAAVSRFFDAGDKPTVPQRSVSRASISSAMTLLRSAFGGSKKPLKQDEDEGEGEGEFLDDTYFADGSSHPIVSFKGGSAWKNIDKECEELEMDLFWPIKRGLSYESLVGRDILQLDELRPLALFRNLRVLKLTGMLQSYQKHIWLAVWNNPQLEELDLDMAVEPCLRRPLDTQWPLIMGDWIPRTAEQAHGSYYGTEGCGELSRDVGFGEYLDKVAIAEAKEKSVINGMAPERLTVVQLTLSGFVVDSDPFFLWFNPLRLRVINFKRDCVDAGFALPKNMGEHVVVSWPRHVGKELTWVRPVKPGEANIIDLGSKKRGGRPSREASGSHVGCGCHRGEQVAAGRQGQAITTTAPPLSPPPPPPHPHPPHHHHRHPFSMRSRARASMLTLGGTSTAGADEETVAADSKKSKKKKSSRLRLGGSNQEASSSTAEPRRFLRLPNGRRAAARKSK